VLVPDGPRSLWAVCVSWTTTVDPEVGRPRPSGDRKPVDYRETLPQADFELYRRLRDWRQTTSKAEGLAPYLPLNNEQLAEIARRRPATLAALGEIDGIGPSKLSKYGVGLLAVVAAGPTEEPSNATNKPPSA
jgi:superfamily II DNA helicase RecQ